MNSQNWGRGQCEVCKVEREEDDRRTDMGRLRGHVVTSDLGGWYMSSGYEDGSEHDADVCCRC